MGTRKKTKTQKSASVWDKFTRKYSLQKTIRFELIPQFETAKNIEKDGIILAKWENGRNKVSGKDFERAQAYQRAKVLLNELHRIFLNDALHKEVTTKVFTKKDFNDLYALWEKASGSGELVASNKWEQALKDLGKKLNQVYDKGGSKWREQLIAAVGKAKGFEHGFKIGKAGAALLYGDTQSPLALLDWRINGPGQEFSVNNPETGESFSKDEMNKILSEFHSFSSYFTGFNENRQNIYETSELKKTGAGHRILKENLEFFFSNIRKWKDLKRTLKNGEILLNGEKKGISKILKGKKWDFNAKCGQIEKSLGLEYPIEDYFEPGNYPLFFSQSGIAEYNKLIGGPPAEENSQKKQGLNEIINLTRQKAGAKRNLFPPFHPLYKQILSEKDSFLDAFEDDKDLLRAVTDFREKLRNKVKNDFIEIPPGNSRQKARPIEWIEKEFREQEKELARETDLKREFYLPVKTVRALSVSLFGNWNFIGGFREQIVAGWKQENGRPLTKKQLESYRNAKVISFVEIEEIVKQAIKEQPTELQVPWREMFLKEKKEFSVLTVLIIQLKQKFEIGVQDRDRHFRGLRQLLEDQVFANLLASGTLGTGKKRGENISLIKEFLDSVLEVERFMKDLKLPAEMDGTGEADGSSQFRQHLELLRSKYFPVLPLYNKARNFATRKPYSTEKIKLNFDHSKLLEGFVESKTEKSDNGTQYGGYIFRKKLGNGDGYNYYLGLSRDARLFRHHLAGNITPDQESEFERLNYYQVKINSIYGASYPGNFSVDKEKLLETINTILNESKKGKNFAGRFDFSAELSPITILNKMAREAPELYNSIRKKRNFMQTEKIITTNLMKSLDTYKDKIPGFTNRFQRGMSLIKLVNEIEKISDLKAYTFFKIDRNELEEVQKREQKRLYLFQIYSKDFSQNKKSRGKDNLHTIYFKQLMSGNAESVFDLGKGEVFFRPASLKKDKPTHKKNTKINSKKNPILTSEFPYDLYKDRRFMENKFAVHLSVNLNYKEKEGKYVNLNTEVLETIKDKPEINIIGIDRGERHLLYYSVVRQNGEIIKQGSLNTLESVYLAQGNKDKTIQTNYHEILQQREGERQKARREWKSIEAIKDLKAGYLSQVVHMLSQLIIKHNAIVVLEDLNTGFKRGRFKVEKQVYQKFERALIEKLNFLVLKDRQEGEPGHARQAWQLTNQFVSFDRLGVLVIT